MLQRTSDLLKIEASAIMDEFILSQGGSLDHRANNNKTRKALILFWERCMRAMPDDFYGTMDLSKAFRAVIDERL